MSRRPSTATASPPPSSGPPALRGRLLLPLVVLAVGLASLLLLVGTSRIRERLIDQDVVRLRALEEVRSRVAIAHLWVEEYVSGDEVEMDQVWIGLAEARGLTDSLLTGGSLPRGDGRVEKLVDPELRRRVEALRGHVSRFETTSWNRFRGFANDEDVGIGSDVDRDYDRMFYALLSEVEGLQDSLDIRLKANMERSSRLIGLILMAWVALIGLAVFGLWQREQRRARAEAELERSRAQLLQSQKLEALGRLAGGIAHDINNYLGAITGQCELVRMKAEPDSRVAKKMGSVIDAAGRASALIKQLLAFSRRQPTAPQVLCLNQLVQELGELMERLIGDDIELKLKLSDDLWPVEIDPTQLEQIIVNLLVNARDAMPTGGTIAIETGNRVRDGVEMGDEPRLKQGDYVMLAVSDTGIGMSPEVQQRVFEPFFTTKRSDGSSGLGLATVYGVVEQNRGSIWVYSEEGTGTSFRIYLPRSRKQATGTSRRWRSKRQRPRGDATVLVVEDNEELRDATEEMLRALGYRVLTAADTREATTIYRRRGGDVDLLLTDVVMPGESGKELADRLRQDHPELPVLFVSGYSDTALLRYGIDDRRLGDGAREGREGREGNGERPILDPAASISSAAPTAFLDKPFSADDLATTVSRLVAAEGGGATTSDAP